MDSELLDVVDEGDNVVGQAPRSECHANSVIHRSVMFFVFDDESVER